MTYATRADMEDRFGAGEIAERAEDPDSPGFDRTAPALAEASAIIDSYLGVAYALPLPAGSWPLLREIQCDIARTELYDDATLDAPKAMKKDAVKRLEMLRDGKLALTDGAGNIVDRRNVAVRRGPPRVMTDDNLAGLNDTGRHVL